VLLTGVAGDVPLSNVVLPPYPAQDRFFMVVFVDEDFCRLLLRAPSGATSHDGAE
jgi:hypothetical protein